MTRVRARVVTAKHAPAPSVPATLADALRLMAVLDEHFPGLIPKPDPRQRVTCGQVVDSYLADAPEEIGERTFETRARQLSSFRAEFGDRLVGECQPIDLKAWMQKNAGRWRSGWTRLGVNVTIQRAFNWSAALGQIARNPFRGYSPRGEKRTGRPVTDAEFRKMLAASPAIFRRFLLAMRWTGARPGELSGLKWEHVDWDRRVAVLHQHKTAHKTGRPRVIVLPPPLVKMLLVMKREPAPSPAVALRRMLIAAPNRTLPRKEIIRRFRALGFGYQSMYRAARAVGAVVKRCGRPAPDVGGAVTAIREILGEVPTLAPRELFAEMRRRGFTFRAIRRARREIGLARGHGFRPGANPERLHTVYYLPANAKEPPERSGGPYVFTNARGRPWKRYSLACRIKRLRRVLGLTPTCKLHGLRHTFITDGMARGVDMKVVSLLVGHKSVRMIEQVYCHLGDNYEHLHRAAVAATTGSGVGSAKGGASNG